MVVTWFCLCRPQEPVWRRPYWVGTGPRQCWGAGPTLTGSSSGVRLRLRETKICYTNLKIKIQFWKIKEDTGNCTFLKVYLFFLSICVTIVIIWLKLQELPQLCHSNRPEPAPFSPAQAPAKKSGSGRLRLHNTGPRIKRLFYIFWTISVFFFLNGSERAVFRFRIQLIPDPAKHLNLDPEDP